MREITINAVASGFVVKVQPDYEAHKRQVEEIRMQSIIAQERDREAAIRAKNGSGWGGGYPAAPQVGAMPPMAPSPIPYPPEPVAEVHAFSTIKEAAAFITGLFTPASAATAPPEPVAPFTVKADSFKITNGEDLVTPIANADARSSRQKLGD